MPHIEADQARNDQVMTTTTSSFQDLGVPAPLVSTLERMRITEPFEIQGLTLPDALAGRDVLGRAPTGSGKTLAFGLAVLSRLHNGDLAGSPRKGRLPASLILSPTRELAEQICRELEPLAREVDRNVLAVYGGKGLERQIQGLRRGVDVLVACPGRLLDLMGQGYADLSEVAVAVVDEADRMADMGFLPDVRRILDRTPADRQTLLFSATLDNDVRVLTESYQSDPVERAVADLEPDLTTMSHRFIKTDKRERAWLTADLITDLGSTVVFVRTRHGVDRLVGQLERAGVRSANLHGGRSQSQRDRALAAFSTGRCQALVATDVAARGIHVDGVACVIHYDPPAEVKDYVHRSGRTARAGADGVVVSFLAPEQVKASSALQKTLGVVGSMEDTPERRHHLSPVSNAPSPRSGKGKGKAKGKGKSKGRSKGSSKSLGGRGKPSAKSGRDRSDSKSSTESRSEGAYSKSGSSPKRGSKSKSGSRSEYRDGQDRRNGSTASSGSDGSEGNDTSRSRSRSDSDGKSRSGSGGKSKPGSKAGGKPRTKTKNGAKAKKGAKAKDSSKGRSKAAKSKRSGKARPKNRKNQPKSRQQS